MVAVASIEAFLFCLSVIQNVLQISGGQEILDEGNHIGNTSFSSSSKSSSIVLMTVVPLTFASVIGITVAVILCCAIRRKAHYDIENLSQISTGQIFMPSNSDAFSLENLTRESAIQEGSGKSRIVDSNMESISTVSRKDMLTKSQAGSGKITTVDSNMGSISTVSRKDMLTKSQAGSGKIRTVDSNMESISTVSRKDMLTKSQAGSGKIRTVDSNMGSISTVSRTDTLKI